MPSTLFVALQCCQCSTMQVKQQKKSSNKWVCVVCNQKQSVRKVFAQGYKAKELRSFVQSFNMSRKSLEEEHALSDTLPEVDDDDEKAPPKGRKRRTDWNEYLDLPDGHHQRSLEEEGNGDDLEPKIVTEMPKDIFKKPRLSNYSNSRKGSDGNQLHKPTFSKRSINNQEPCLESVAGKKHSFVGAGGGAPKGASRWNAYMTEVEHEARGLKDADECDQAVLEIGRADQRVEDDVHPDFM